jgi:histidine triad (HIT) family protein
MESDCLFCKIVAGDIPSNVVLETDTVFAFRDVNPTAPTHVLVVPREHVRDATEIAPEHGSLLADLIAAANEIARADGVDESGYRLVLNVGPDAGQSVFHLHLHVIGGRSMAWPPG